MGSFQDHLSLWIILSVNKMIQLHKKSCFPLQKQNNSLPTFRYRHIQLNISTTDFRCGHIQQNIWTTDFRCGHFQQNISTTDFRCWHIQQNISTTSFREGIILLNKPLSENLSVLIVFLSKSNFFLTVNTDRFFSCQFW